MHARKSIENARVKGITVFYGYIAAYMDCVHNLAESFIWYDLFSIFDTKTEIFENSLVISDKICGNDMK